MRLVLVAFLGGLLIAGCAPGVTNSDTQAMRKEFSEENYEKAMHAAGKDAELQREKEAAARRGEPQ